MALALAFAAVFGLIIGSFLNVVAYRLPRGESLAAPASRCPNCDAPIRPYDNVPVLSWLMLRGKCRNCGAPISIRYPVVETVTAVLYVTVVAVMGIDDAEFVIGLVLVTLLVPVTLIDLDYQLIPNKLLAPAAVAAIVLVAIIKPEDLIEHLIAGVAAGLFLLIAALVYPGGMGMGDVKLAAVLGLFLGASVAVAMLVALFAGVIVGIGIMARRGVRAGRKVKVPFGPFLSLGAIVALLAGAEIIDWYRGLFS